MPPPHTNALSQRLTTTDTYAHKKRDVGNLIVGFLRSPPRRARGACALFESFFFARTTFFRLGKNEDLAVDLLVLLVFRLDDNLEAIVLLSVARSIDLGFFGDEQ